MSNTIRILIVLVTFVIMEILLRRVNLRKDIRGRQVLMIYLSPVIVVAEAVLAYLYYDKIVFEKDSELFGAEVFIWNIVIFAAFLLIKTILCPILKIDLSNERIFKEWNN